MKWKLHDFRSIYLSFDGPAVQLYNRNFLVQVHLSCSKPNTNNANGIGMAAFCLQQSGDNCVSQISAGEHTEKGTINSYADDSQR